MGDYGRQRGQERVSTVGGCCAFDVRVPLVYVACRQIDIGKLRKLAVDFELTNDVDALHREVDLDQSGASATKIIDSLLQSHCLLVPLKNHTRHRRSVVRRVHAHDIEGIPKSPTKFLTLKLSISEHMCQPINCNAAIEMLRKNTTNSLERAGCNSWYHSLLLRSTPAAAELNTRAWV